MLLLVGPLGFKVTGPHFDRLRHSYDFVWPAHERFGQAPAYQFTGAGPEAVDIEGTVYPEYFAGFEALRSLAGRASRPQVVVSGSGDVFGLWIVSSLSTRQSYFDTAGNPRKIDFRIELRKYQGQRGVIGRLI